MNDFKEVLKIADAGYHNRDDYPPYAIDPMTDRNRWREYMMKIDNELHGPRPPDGVTLIGYVYHCSVCGETYKHEGIPSEPHCKTGDR